MTSLTYLPRWLHLYLKNPQQAEPNLSPAMRRVLLPHNKNGTRTAQDRQASRLAYVYWPCWPNLIHSQDETAYQLSRGMSIASVQLQVVIHRAGINMRTSSRS